MERKDAHADGTLLLRGQLPKRTNVQLFDDKELAFSPTIKFLLDASTLDLVLLAVFVLAFLVAVPNALAPVAQLDGVTLRAARRTQLGRGWDLNLLVLGVFGSDLLSFLRFAPTHESQSNVFARLYPYLLQE